MRLGADEVVVSKDADAMQAQAGSFDLILNTVAASHDLDQFMNLLKRDGTMVLVGAPEHAHPSPNVMNLIFRRRTIAGSLIGGLPETQEMLDFCAEHNITCDIEMIRMDQINEAYERMLKSDVKYRFVIDMSSLKRTADQGKGRRKSDRKFKRDKTGGQRDKEALVPSFPFALCLVPFDFLVAFPSPLSLVHQIRT